MVWLSIPYNFLVFVLAMGVWASAGGKRATRFTAAALVGYGAVSTAGLLLFPMDVRGTVESQRDILAHCRHDSDVDLHRGDDGVRGFRYMGRGSGFTHLRPSQLLLCLAPGQESWLVLCRGQRRGWVSPSESIFTRRCCGWRSWQSPFCASKTAPASGRLRPLPQAGGGLRGRHSQDSSWHSSGQWLAEWGVDRRLQKKGARKMRLLIGYASRFGSTRDIAIRIADTRPRTRQRCRRALGRRDLGL